MAPRGLVPVALAVGFGILNGYVVFQPAYAEREAQKFKQAHEQSTSGELGGDGKEVPVTTNSEVSKINSSTNPMARSPASTSTDPAQFSYTRTIYNWWNGGNSEGRVNK